jgi:uncharacterized coiled-coil protein SlyX
MTGFDELVEQVERDVARPAGGALAPGAALEQHLARQRQLSERLRAELEALAGNLDPYALDPDRTTSRTRRFLAKRLRGLLRAGGLGKHLGANQLRANQATLAGLRLLQQQVAAQEQALAELAAALGERAGPHDAGGARP